MTRLLVKVDENLGWSHAELLREQGYEADTVHDEGLSGVDDETLWRMVLAEGRFLITLDLGFSDIRRFGPGTHPGILLIRASRKGRSTVMQVLHRALSEHRLETLRGCLVVADEDLTRVRRPPTATSP